MQNLATLIVSLYISVNLRFRDKDKLGTITSFNYVIYFSWNEVFSEGASWF